MTAHFSPELSHPIAPTISSYSAILKDATKVAWTVRDVMGNSSLDFSQAFLPEALAHTQAIDCLTDTERLKLNQIRGNSYLNLFGVVEEAIIPLVVDRVREIGCDDIEATQAYLGFAEEEAKHIHLFRTFARAFAAGFGSPCECIGPPSEIATFIHQHSPLGVALMVLHVEWMTQRHYLESVRGNHLESLEPLFCSLLRHHWMEEAQHARLDNLMVKSLAQTLDEAAIATGIDDYLAILKFLNTGLTQQVQLDIDSLCRAIDRPLSNTERQAIQAQQLASYQRVFLSSGVTHPQVIACLQDISPVGYQRISNEIQSFS